MSVEDWKEQYKKAIEEWKEGYKKAIEEWKEKLEEFRHQIVPGALEGGVHLIPSLPPKISLPPFPSTFPFHGGRSNVVASRIGDEELRSIDMMVETGLFETRSEAVAYLVTEGIKARKDLLDKVSLALEDIRRLRREAEEQINNLRKKVGLIEKQDRPSTSLEKTCPKCDRNLFELPKDIKVCPYCGTKI